MSRYFRLGVFIVSALLIFATAVFLIGSRQFLFSSTYQLRTTFNNVAGLGNGADVRVGGIHSGTVKVIQLPSKPGEQVAVVMQMQSDTSKVLHKDSVAAIQAEGLLGNKFVEVSFGSPDAPAVTDGMTIQGAPPVDISDLVLKTDQILETTKQTMLNVRNSTEHVREISEKINEGEGTVGALVNDKTFYERLNETTAQAKIGAAAFQENMQALKTNFFLRGFFNRRGYDDSTKLTANEIPNLPKGERLREFTYDVKKVFGKNDAAKLKDAKQLDEAGRFLESNPFAMTVVVARQGMKGDSEEARILTQARAMNVRDYLVDHFRMDDTRVKTMGAGKDETNWSGDAGTLTILVYSQAAAATAKK